MQTTIASLARVSRVVPSRGLATNLLAHPIEQLALADLKQEAKRRGLSSSGNKATLITRIQHVEKGADGFTATINDPSHRGLATATAPQKSSRPTLDVKLPDLSLPLDPEGPQIPFLPDFWDSSRVRAPDAIHHRPAPDSPMPKVLIVDGTHASGPSYDSSQHSESEEDHHKYETVANGASNTGFWGDVAEDLGLTQSVRTSAPLSKMRDAALSMSRDSARHRTENRTLSSRPLDADERKGLKIIISILGVSWIVGWIFGPPKERPTSSTKS